MKKIAVLLVFILSCFMAMAEGEEGIQIKNVEFRNLKEVPSEVLLEKMKSQKGSSFTTKNMTEDYKVLKELEYIQDLKIFPETKNGELSIVVEAVEKEDAKDRLKKNGLIPLSERGNIDASFIVKSIEIFGIKSSNKDEIKKKIPIQVGSYFSKEKVLEGREELLKTGHFREVTPDALKYENGIYIKYTVIENPILKGIEVEGNKLISTEELLKNIATKAGEPYNTDTLREDADKIMKKYHDKGYVLASIDDMRIDDYLNLKIKISEGILKGIEFKGVTSKEDKTLEKVKDINESEEIKESPLKTKKYIMEREIVLKVGEPFELEKFQKSVKNIFRLGYFKSINQEFKRSPDGEGVILVLVIDENKSGSIQGAVSYGSEEGIVGSFSVTEHNFRGESKNLGISFEATSKHRKKYELTYSDPWIKGTNKLSMSTSIYRKELEDNSSDTTKYIRKTGISGSIGKALTENIRVRFGSRIEKISENQDIVIVSDEGDNKGEGELKEERVEKYMNLVLNPSIYYDSRDNYLNATKGFYGKVGVEVGKLFDKKIYNDETVSPNISTVRGKDIYKIAEIELRAYHKLIFKNDTMAYRVMYGAADKSTPEELYFYVGGGSSVRGADSVTGRYQFIGNIENRLKVEDNIQFVAFFDAGKAWGKENIDRRENNTEELRMGYGIGIRADTPLGPLRFDYAWPIDDENKKGKFYFNVGQMF